MMCVCVCDVCVCVWKGEELMATCSPMHQFPSVAAQLNDLEGIVLETLNLTEEIEQV